MGCLVTIWEGEEQTGTNLILHRYCHGIYRKVLKKTEIDRVQDMLFTNQELHLDYLELGSVMLPN